LLTFSGLLTVAAIVMAIAALLRARRATRRLERLSESYWELRYEAGQLKSRLSRLEAATGIRDADEHPVQQQPVTTAFVPLSSLKK
jgi:hypothetical protein